jgi:hypothetical protein
MHAGRTLQKPRPKRTIGCRHLDPLRSLIHLKFVFIRVISLRNAVSKHGAFILRQAWEGKLNAKSPGSKGARGNAQEEDDLKAGGVNRWRG